MGTTPNQGSTVSTYSQGSRVEFTGKRGEDEPTMFMRVWCSTNMEPWR
ncbi:unnamed protein product [Pylaiella littoralis]